MSESRGCALIASLLVGLTVTMVPRMSPAAEFRAGQNVVVAADEVVTDDLYATGETVTVHGRIEGDLVASGREIRLHGEVAGDMMAAGQAVVINGSVGDDARIAGMVLRLGPAASIGDDVIAAGLGLETEAGSRTGGGVLFSGFQALLAGDVTEGLSGAMSALEIHGRVGGDSAVEVEGDPAMFPFVQYIPTPEPLPTVAGGLTFGDSAEIDGRFEYTSSQEAAGSGAGAGTVEHIARPDAGDAAQGTVRKPAWPGRIQRWIGLIILGLLVTWRAPRWLESRGAQLEARPLLAGGVGFLGVAALPIGAVLLLVAAGLLAALLGLIKLGNLAALTFGVGMIAVCMTLLVFWLTASYLAPLVVGLCTGRWLVGRFAPERAAGLVVPLVAGLVVLALLRFIPLLGALTALVVVLMGWGVVLLWLGQQSRPAS